MDLPASWGFTSHSLVEQTLLTSAMNKWSYRARELCYAEMGIQSLGHCQFFL